jgi:hypothetical protein
MSVTVVSIPGILDRHSRCMSVTVVFQAFWIAVRLIILMISLKLWYRLILWYHGINLRYHGHEHQQQQHHHLLPQSNNKVTTTTPPPPIQQQGNTNNNTSSSPQSTWRTHKRMTLGGQTQIIDLLVNKRPLHLVLKREPVGDGVDEER